MDLLKDALGGNAVAVAVAGATALVVPALAPSLTQPLRAMVKLGIGLFMESESEAEAQLVQELVRDTLNGVLGALSGPGSAAQRRQAAAAHIEDFEARARRRAARFARGEQGRAARYRRQVASLKQAISHAKGKPPKVSKPALEHVSDMVAEDW